MNILITGANGQLGSEIRELSVHYPVYTFFFTDAEDLDICNYNQVDAYIIEKRIKTVINCAAYTAVDKAETNEKIAEEVNSKGVKNLVEALAKVDGKIIHISTDYVFDGTNHIPYTETETTQPIGVYGHTKRISELHVLDSKLEGIVIRTSWVYSSYGNNFVKTMLRLGNERDELGVIFDQIGTPTYARDLAKVCLEILSNTTHINGKGNLYHFSNEGVASWYDFAKAIMEISNTDCKVKPIETKDYPTPAKRPHYSLLNKAKIKQDFAIEIPYWRDSLKECIFAIQKSKLS